MYKLKLFKTDYKYAAYYLENIRKLGYKPYRYVDKMLEEEWFGIDVLVHEDYYRDPDMKFTSYGDVTTWDFKK